MKVHIFTASFPGKSRATDQSLLLCSEKRCTKNGRVAFDLHTTQPWSSWDTRKVSPRLKWYGINLNRPKSFQTHFHLLPSFFLIFIVFICLWCQLHNVFHTDLPICSILKKTGPVRKQHKQLCMHYHQQNIKTSGRTFVFREVADKLLDAFLSYCILQISCCWRYLLRSHLAIKIPANKIHKLFVTSKCNLMSWSITLYYKSSKHQAPTLSRRSICANRT